jgi:small subunit ribosomal protein S5
MTDEEKKTTQESTPPADPKAEASTEEKAPETEKKAEAPDAEKKAPAGKDDRRGNRGRGRGGNDRRGKGGRGRGRGRGRREPDDGFESKIIDLARVTRVMAGGKRMSFRACVLVGDKKGNIGMGVKKGADVQLAVSKATAYAKKHLITVKTVEGTIPHRVEKKFKGAHVLLKPAKAGTGIIAGGPVRIVMELSGIHNIVAKIKGSSNKVNNLTAVVKALESMVTQEEIEKIKESK